MADVAADLAAIDEEIGRLATQISERHPDDELAVILDWQQIDELLEHRYALSPVRLSGEEN